MSAASTPPPVLRLAARDEVAVALRRLAPGTPLDPVAPGVSVREPIELGHKVALLPIAEGALVHKFGVPIGRATRPIAPGEHVHVHNLESLVLKNAVDHAED
ncbi:MAG: UxaA family hydrolase [Geminicoccaceae bacterium]|nr:UxaA family hydrolase [Geminicoccaceae bacterium]MDW8371986.1 UxaA family hydrolase [Geminicoccaceae bacterium]